MQRVSAQVLAASAAFAAIEARNLKAFRAVRTMDFSKPKRRKIGVKYPFSSTRQNERFARQLAAGKVQFV
jgi:hypothetical protein